MKTSAIEDPPETKRREQRRVYEGGMEPTTVIGDTRGRKIICKCRGTAEVEKYSRSKAVKCEDIAQAGFSRRDLVGIM